jgi:trehalose 6-phosphate synthase
MVTPLRDGMNLVAKEYVAAQDASDPGVLILSQFAGAAEEMTEALIVNPYNIEETADLIKNALEMPLEERQARYNALMASVRMSDAGIWARSFLAQLERVRSAGAASETPAPIRDALERLHQSSVPRLRRTRRSSAHSPIVSG